MNEKLTGKQFLNKVLAGMSMGIIISLLPGSLIGEVAKIFGWQPSASRFLRRNDIGQEDGGPIPECVCRGGRNAGSATHGLPVCLRSKACFG